MAKIKWLLFAILLVLCQSALAQTGTVKSPTVLSAETNTFWPDNTVGAITPFNARQTLLDIIASYANLLNFNSSLALDGSNNLGINPTNPESVIWTADQYFGSGRPWCDIRSKGAAQNGAESGGIWSGTDDTAAWTACNTELAALGGGAIVVDPAPGFSCVKSGFTPAAGVFILGFGNGYGGIGSASAPGAPSVVSTCGADVTLFIFSNPATGMKGIYAQGAAFGTNPAVNVTSARAVLENNFIIGGAPPLQLSCAECVLIANEIQGGYAGVNSNISANVYATGGFYGIRNNFDTTWFGAPAPGTLNAGAIAAWASTTAYSAGNIVTMTGPDGKSYYVKVPSGGGGTSGSGSQPTVMPVGQTFTDGTVTWRLLRPVGPGGFYYDIQCDGCGTLFLQQNDLSGAAIGLGITNNVSAVPQNNNLVNNSFGNNWGYGIYAHDGWGLNVIGGYVNSCATVSCVGIASAGNWASSLQIADVLMFNNPTGVSFGAGTESALKGSQIFNSSAAAVNVAANLTDVTVSNNMLGNDTTHGANANAVTIQSGTGDYLTIVNNDVNGATAGITNGASGTHLNICNNLGDATCIMALPNPSASTLGGIKSIVAATHEWIDSISTAGVPHQSQPAFSDLSGSATAGQLPAATYAAAGIAMSGCNAYTPTDQSGASLTFSAASGEYCINGPSGSQQVTVYFSVTYPSTASASQAKISAPLTSANQPFAALKGPPMESPTVTNIIPDIAQSGTVIAFTNVQNNTVVTNVTLSLAEVSGTITYPLQ
jgi:hypothetical protein